MLNMFYYEVWVASSKYRGDRPLTYRSSFELAPLSVVSVPLRNGLATGFVANKVTKPGFTVKEIRANLSDKPLPSHCLALANWISDYYCTSLGEALRQFAPSVPAIRRRAEGDDPGQQIQEDLRLDFKLTAEQISAIDYINNNNSTTVLLHGDTGSGKTRVYLELAEAVLETGRSVIMLTPEIGLTTQLTRAVTEKLNCPVQLLHSEMTPAARKKAWFKILETDQPMVVIGPRSALFAPLAKVGLIVVDEAHDTAYKQEQTPYYHASRVASRLGNLTGSKVILGSATPSEDYYLAKRRKAIFRMKLQAKSARQADISIEIVDQRDKFNSSKNRYLSDPLIKQVEQALADHKQTILYYNRRGTARLILCSNCGWQLLCPNCDIPLVYHGDDHEARCHTCGYKQVPPGKCPSCGNPDIVFTSIGTKALADLVTSFFPSARVKRFDSDNVKGEKLNELYESVRRGEVDILVGTQLIAKGLDLPKLQLVGIVGADSSLAIPDYSAQERSFQLLYQVIGRVGRHAAGKIVIQTFEPDSYVIAAAASRNYEAFYVKTLAERRTYRFPPFSYMMKLSCHRSSEAAANKAASDLRTKLATNRLGVEVIGPVPSFRHRIGKNYYYQLVLRAKQRGSLTQLTKQIPAGWSIDLDPINLL